MRPRLISPTYPRRGLQSRSASEDAKLNRTKTMPRKSPSTLSFNVLSMAELLFGSVRANKSRTDGGMIRMIQCRVAYQSPRSIEGVYGPGLTQFIGRAVSRLCPEWVNNGPDGS